MNYSISFENLNSNYFKQVKIETSKKSKVDSSKAMNQTQVQVFRLLLRNLQTYLVDLSYGFSLKNPPNAKETIVTPLIISIDNSIRSILSTFDEKIKCEVVRDYFSSSYLKVIEFRDKYEPILINDIQNLKTDFISFLKQESLNSAAGASSDISSDHANFEILKEQIASKLKILDEPFGDISSPPFAIVEYFLSFKSVIHFQEENLISIINRGNLYIYFFKFLRQLRLIENYKDRFDDGDIPSDCSQHLVEANYVPDQVQSTKVIMPLVKTQKIDPSMPSWSILPKDSNSNSFGGPNNYSVSLKNKFSGLKINGLLESPDPIYLQPHRICDTKVFDPNSKYNKENGMSKISSETSLQSAQQSTKEIKSNENSNRPNTSKTVNDINNNTNNTLNKNNTNSNNINDNSSPENARVQKSNVKGSKIGTASSKSLSNLKLGSKSSLAMLQRLPKNNQQKSSIIDKNNSNNSEIDNVNNNNASNNNNNPNTNSTYSNENANTNNINSSIDAKVQYSPVPNLDPKNNILNAIKGISSLDDNNDDINNNNFLEDYRKGVIAINNSIYNDNKNDASQNSPRSNSDDDESALNRYAQMVQKLETSKQQLQEWSQIIIARLQQKALLLQKENQLLRENLDIVSKQKFEIVEMYETQINELSEQSEFLKNENLKLKKKVSSNKSDYTTYY